MSRTYDKTSEEYIITKEIQNKLRKDFLASPSYTLQCPYCSAIIGKYSSGRHGKFETRCHKCNEFIVFPEVAFSRAAS